MGKKKTNCGEKKSGGVSWLSEIRRNEVQVGCVREPLWKIYPNLKNFIWRTNNETDFKISVRRNFPNKTSPLEYGGSGWNVHPYDREIDHFTCSAEYRNDMTTRTLSKLNVPDSFPVLWIEAEADLKKLVSKLSTCSNVFIDLEGHSWRSYRGITCLLQISDGDAVYFVDTLKLNSSVKLLEGVFTNPNIVKVFHACANDILSMQRDFGVFMVGVLDTQVMFEELTGRVNISYKDIVHQFYPEAGLDKGSRSTDFRLRPLKPEQVKYAYLDVYYLPWLYCKLFSQLSSEQLEKCISTCRVPSKNLYQHPKLLKVNFNDVEVLRQLKLCRDIVARKEDVNPEFICSTVALNRLVVKSQERLGITVLPGIHECFFKYQKAISEALKGRDPKGVFETEYRDLGIQFPYSMAGGYCYNCEKTGHVKRDCPHDRSLGKQLKRQHYDKNPDKRIRQTRRRNANRKLKPESRRKVNVRNNRRKWKRKQELIRNIINN